MGIWIKRNFTKHLVDGRIKEAFQNPIPKERS